MTTASVPDTSAGFTDEQWRRLLRYGTVQDVEPGDVLYAPGESSYDLVAVVDGVVEIVRAGDDGDIDVVAWEGSGGILGEMSLLSGQAVWLTARVREGGTVSRVDPASLRRLMSEDGELSEILLTTFMTRREELRASASRALELIGDERSAAALALRTYAFRLGLPHEWHDAAAADGPELLARHGLTREDLPAALTVTGPIANVTPGLLAERLGLSYPIAEAGSEVDLVVVGAGPAGLAAAVYGSSEGLRTVLLDSVGPGGQAAASSRIENYLGFPHGLSGEELSGLAQTQALKFGTSIYSPCEVVSVTSGEGLHRVLLADGVVITSRVVIGATGARYRTLPLERWHDFEGAGIYYAATNVETRRVAGMPVTVVGGANSAGQASLYLAAQGCKVDIVIRRADIREEMSSYLVDRIVADPAITIRTGSNITALHGRDYLTGATITGPDGRSDEVTTAALFCFIGATPASEWMGDVARDDRGFVLTDSLLESADLGPLWETAGRPPLPFETSIPGLFAVGDVRRGSMKRVAAAVGEGASAVASAHQAIAAQNRVAVKGKG